MLRRDRMDRGIIVQKSLELALGVDGILEGIARKMVGVRSQQEPLDSRRKKKLVFVRAPSD